jgi:hypothetical protein
MNIKRIYNLDDVVDTMYGFPRWCNHDAWWLLVGNTIDCQNFNYSDAYGDERIKVHLKAHTNLDSLPETSVTLEYVAVSYDNIYIGLVIGVDRPFGWDAEEIYVTNYPKYQSMIAYAQALYQNKPNNIVGETTKIGDLDGRFGFVIDKRFANNLRKEDD